MTQITQKEVEDYLKAAADTVVPLTSYTAPKPMARTM